MPAWSYHEYYDKRHSITRFDIQKQRMFCVILANTISIAITANTPNVPTRTTVDDRPNPDKMTEKFDVC